MIKFRRVKVFFEVETIRIVMGILIHESGYLLMNDDVIGVSRV